MKKQLIMKYLLSDNITKATRLVCLVALFFISQGVMAQTYTATWLDGNGDGDIDQLRLDFSPNVDIVDADVAGFSAIDIGGAITIDESSGYAASDVAFIVLDVSGATGTSDPGVSISYVNAATNGTGSSIITNAGSLPASTELVNTSNPTTIIDGASPVINGAAYLDTNSDGQIDRIDVTFSESIAGSAFESADWSFPTNTETIGIGSGVIAGSDVQITVTGAPTGNTAIGSTTVQYTDGTTAGSITDGTNVSATSSVVTVDDGASPVINGAAYLDTNSDGQIDRIDVTFSESIAGSTFESADWSFPTNTETIGIGSGVIAGSDVQITVTGAPAGNTAIGSTTVQYTDGTTAGSITDGTNVSATSSVVTVDDGASPVINGATYLDTNSDGQIDRIDVTFSESIAGSAFESADWSFPTNTETIGIGSGVIAGSDVQITVTGVPAGNTAIGSTTVQYTDGTTAGSITDGTNVSATSSVVTVDDGALPVFVNAIQFDLNGDGNIDEIVIEISEPFNDATLEATDFGLSAGTISSVSDNGAGTDNTTDAGGDNFFTLEVSVTGTAPVTVDYTESGGGLALEDANGNLAADNGAINSVDSAVPLLIIPAVINAGNSSIDLSFSEGVYNSSGGALTAGDFDLSFLDNGGTATNVTIVSLSTITNTPLTGGDFDIRIELSQSGPSDGNETIEITPALATSIEDFSGNNPILATSTGAVNLLVSNVVTVNSATIASNNSFYEITFSEGVEKGEGAAGEIRYGNNREIEFVSFNDPDGTVTFNDGNVSLTNNVGGAVVVGDDIVRLDLSTAISGTPDGNEVITFQNDDRIEGSVSGGLLEANFQFIFTLNDQRPTILSANYYDTNGDGVINEVMITGEADFDDATLVLTDFSFEGTNPISLITPGSVANPDDPASGTTDDQFITFEVNIPGTSTPTTATFATGNLLSSAGLGFQANIDITRNDLASPVIQSVQAISNTLIQLQYGEDINPGTFLFTNGYSVSGGPNVLGVALNGGDNSIVEITVDNLGSTDYNGTLNLTVDVDDIIEDASGNDVADLVGFTIDDVQAPTFLSAIQFDTDGDGNIDEIVIEMSEGFNNATLDENDFGLSAGTVNSISDNGGGTSNAIDADGDNFFTLEVSVTGTASVIVDYTENGAGLALEDAAGNPALDNGAITSDDRAVPVFSFTTPADGASNVSVSTIGNQIIFELSEAVIANGGAFINIFRDAISVESIEANSASVNVGGTTVTITLSAILSKGSSYSVSIEAGAFSDGNGNNTGLNATWNWDMESLGSPNIIGGFPTGINVPLSTDIRIFFDESVRYANTDEGGTFDANVTISVISGVDANFPRSFSTLSQNSGSEDPGFSPPSNADNDITINDTITLDVGQSIPPVSFLPNVTYQVSIGDAAFEFAGSSADTQPFSFQFTTVADGTAPTLVSFVPVDQADFTNTVDAATTTNLDIIFNENVEDGTGNIQLFLDSDNDGTADATVFDIASSNPAVSFINENFTDDKLRINLTTLGITLSGGVTYFLNVDNDAVQDVSGNLFAGFSDATTWNFTTLTEGIAPVLVSISPADNSTNVAISSNFVLNFDEVVTIGTTEEVRLFLSNNDQLIETVLASSLNVNNNEVTVDFINDLSGFTDYYITIESGAILDFSGNAYAGFSNKNTWNFKTEAGTDVSAPIVTALDPIDGATNISTLPDFTITFNEPVFSGSGNFYVRDGVIIETFDVASDVVITGNVISFSSTVSLTNNTAYTVEWDAGVVTDSEGNGLAVVGSQPFLGDGSWDFTTIPDTGAPMIVSQVPANDATGVTPDINISLVINFDEAVDIGTGNLEIFYNDGSPLVPPQSPAVSGFVLSNSDQTATLTVGPLDGSTEYYVSLPGTSFSDKAVPANSVAGINPDGSWSFVTAADASLPTISSLNPVNAGTGVDLTGTYVMNFSERVFAGSGNVVLTSTSQTITINVADGTQISGFGTNQITLDPNVELFNGELYTVSVDAGAISDASGNDFDPASLTWSFTTETGVTVTAPIVDLCVDGGFVNVGDIIIDESGLGDFVNTGGSQTLILQLPSGFEFNAGVGSASSRVPRDFSSALLTVGTNMLTLTYVVGSETNDDQITLSGLEMRYTGTSSLTNVNVLRTGTGNMKGNQPLQQQPHIILNTNLAPTSPSIEEPSAVGTFITELALESVATSTLSLQVNSSIGTSTYNWENIETNNAFSGDAVTEVDLTSDADFDVLTNNLYSFDVTETDLNGCVSPATRFNVLNYDLTLNPNVTAFSEDDNTGADITISKPANHSATFSGTALGSISIPADGVSGNAVATFVPSTAGSGGSPYQITYSITNLNTGESFDLIDGLNFTVSSLVTIFTNVVPVEYCFTGDDINNNIDIDVSITPPNFYFYRIALFDDTGNEVVGAISPENTTNWQNSGIVIGLAGFPAVPTRVAGGHFSSDNWILDPATVSVAGQYEIRYFIIKDGIPETLFSSEEIVFRTQDIEIFELPDVELSSFTSATEFYCEDNGPVTIIAALNSSVVTVDDFSLLGTNGPASGLSATITGNIFDPSDPLENGLSYASSRYILTYTSDAADDVNGCVNTVSQVVVNLAKPATPALTDGTDLGTEILFEYCEGEAIPDFQVASPSGSPTRYYWQDNNGTIPTLDTLTEGSSASVFDLFNTANPSPGTYSFTVKRSDFTNNPNIDGCESDVQNVTVVIYDQPLLPELDLSSSTNGFEVSAQLYEYNYCVGDVYENFVLTNTLSASSADSSFLWLNENKNLIPVATFADPLNMVVTPEELGLDIVDLSSTFDTTFFVITGEFRNTPQFNGCFSDTVAINITIHANPMAPAIGDTSFDFFTDYYACAGDATVTGDGSEQLTALRTPQGTDETYNWYEDSDGTGTTPGVFITTGVNIPLVTLSAATINLDLNTAGIYYFWVTRTTDANPAESFDGCESPATRIAVTVYPNATAPDVTNEQGMVGSNFAFAFCEGEITTATNFTVDQTYAPFMGGTGLTREFRWYQSNVSGAITNPTAINVSSADGSTATAVELGLVGAVPQTRYFLVTHVENIRTDMNFEGCESSGSLIQIDIQDIPGRPLVTGGNVIEYCNGDVVNDIAVTGEGNLGEVFVWYDGDGVEVYRGNVASATDLSIVSNLPATVVEDSVFTFTVTQIQDIDFNGFTFQGCEGPSQAISVIIHPIPVQPVVSVAGSLEICVGEGLPTLSLGNQLPGATLSWRNSMGVEVSTASNFDPVISNTTPGVNTFSVIQILDDCPSLPTNVTITVNAFPLEPVVTGNTVDGFGATINDLFEFCAESDVSTQTLDVASPVATSTYTWYPGISAISPLLTGSSVDFVDLDFASGSLNINSVGSTSFFVRETNSSGCEGPAKEVIVVINPLPVLTIDNLTTQYCFDDGVFTITGLNNGLPISTGTATFSINTGGLVDNGDGTASITPSIAAIAAGETREGDVSMHTVTFTFLDDNSCQNSVTVDFNINPQPVLTIETPALTACYDDGGILLQGVVDGVDATNGSFIIDTPGGLIDNGDGTALFTPEDAALAAGETETGNPTIHMVTFSLVDVNGCENMTTVTLTVNPLPDLDIVLESSTTTSIDGIDVCYDDAEFLIRGFADGAIATSGSFSADFGGLTDNGDGSARFNPSVAAIAAAETREGDFSTHTITYNFRDALGCTNSISRIITVNPQPTLDIVFDANNSTIQNELICFDATPFTIIGRQESGGAFFDIIADDISINTGGLTFNGTTGIATLDPQAAAIAAGGTLTGDATVHQISLTYTDGLNCSNTITYNLTITPLPEVSIRNQDGSALTTQYCVDDTNQIFQAFADNASVTTGATFTLNGSNISVTNGQVNFSPSGLGVGDYTLEMTYLSGTDPFCDNVVTEIITVNPLPVVDIVLESDNAISINGTNYCYDDSSVTFRGFADGVPANAGAFTAQFGGLADNGDGTATFDPEIAAIGAGETREGSISNHNISYTFTDPATNCENTIVHVISVSPQPTLDIVFTSNNSSINNTKLCFDEGIVQIKGRVEVGGVFLDRNADNISISTAGLTYDATSGVATLDTEVAALAAGGTITGDETIHMITMDYTDPLGCENSITYELTISPKPEVSIRNEDGSSLTTNYCVDDGSRIFQAVADNENVISNVTFTLNGSPLAVVSGQVTFSPTVVGVGSHLLEMIYTSDENPFCQNSFSTTLIVSPLPLLTIIGQDSGVQLGSDNLDEFCFDETSIVLEGRNNGLPVNGTWRVQSQITGGSFQDLPSSVIVVQTDGTAIFNPNAAALASGMIRTGDEMNMRVLFSFTDANACSSEAVSEISINPQPSLEIVRENNNTNISGTSVCFDEVTFNIRGRFDGSNIATSGVFSINTSNTSGGLVDNGDGTASITAALIATDNGQSRIDGNQSYIVNFTYSDDNGCENTIASEFTINGQPVISFDNDVVINGGTTTFITESNTTDILDVCVAPIDLFTSTGTLPSVVILNGRGSSGDFSGTGVTNVGNGLGRFIPFQARGGDLYSDATTYTIFYTVNETDETGTLCTNTISQVIRVNPIPNAIPVTVGTEVFRIAVNKACQEEEANVSVEIDNVDPANLQYQWSVGGVEIAGATGSSYNDDLAGNNDRERDYTVRVTNTLNGCSIDYSRNVSFGVKPNPKFKWDYVTAGRPTTFTFIDQNLIGTDEFESLEFYLTRDVNDTIFKSDPFLNIDLGGSFDITIADPGEYLATMVVNTINGCSKAVTRTLNIIPYIAVNNSGYVESFELSDGGWFTDSVQVNNRFERIENNSWERGVPNGTQISTAGEGAFAWVSDLTGTYQNNELSYVYSPTFNVSLVDRPTISFQRIVDFDTNDDGSILQLSLDGGITWTNLGDVTDENSDNVLEQSGILWYNNLSVRGFLNDPSNPTIVGWTTDGERDQELTTDGTWITSIHKLDLSSETADSVRFRFAIGTNADGVAEGFGFDNFRIFSRDRLSVIETFSTVLSDLSIIVNDSTNKVLSNPSLLLSDVIWVNYFNDFENNRTDGRVDPLNNRNQIVPGTISTFYGINKAPRAVINGEVQLEIPENAEPGFELRGWSINNLSNSSLSEPLVDIELNEVITQQDEVNLNIRVVSNNNFPLGTELTVRIFVVETQIDPEDINPELEVPITSPVYNVVREMLPDPDGFNFVGTVDIDGLIGEYNVNWDVSGVYHPDRLKAVVYVQNEADKVIYQAAAIDLAAKVNVITGVEEQFISGEDFAIYPNPANDIVNVVFNKPIQEETQFRLIDQTGKILVEGNLALGTKEFPIPTDKLSGGIYFVNIANESVTLKPRRVVIIPR